MHICVVCRQDFCVKGHALLQEFLVFCLQTGQRESASIHQPYAEGGGCRNFIFQNKAWPLLNAASPPINPPSWLTEIPSLLPLLPNNAFFWHLPMIRKRQYTFIYKGVTPTSKTCRTNHTYSGELAMPRSIFVQIRRLNIKHDLTLNL